MDETHTIAAALPTAEDDDQAEFHGRAPRPTAIKLMEDMVPRELFITHIMAEANPSENLHAMLAAAQAAAAEAEEAA